MESGSRTLITTDPPFPCRVFASEVDRGAMNMAIDESLLDLVSREPSAAALRIYGWTEPTLSLGYFQSIADVEADPRWRSLPVVRRPTGGGAIWHDREVTYALAIPRSHPLSRQNNTLYQAVHSAIAGMLIERGVAARRRGEIPGPLPRERPFLCFADRDAEDIVIGDCKVVGSAQRRRSGAILQHGSLLLSRSPTTPELRGASDLGPVSADPDAWTTLLGTRLAEAIGMRGHRELLPESVRGNAAALEKAVYSDRNWTRRR